MVPWVLLKLLFKNSVSRKRAGQSSPKFQKVIKGSQSAQKCKKFQKIPVSPRKNTKRSVRQKEPKKSTATQAISQTAPQPINQAMASNSTIAKQQQMPTPKLKLGGAVGTSEIFLEKWGFSRSAGPKHTKFLG
ncbi:hypothetical protein AVEN_262513-1 [Araneus ventricosus]|uniref:Uncharacterized protein n=1 Tax=Araneus ventricosus TaxID=182803 RepID=A0A4Y2HYH3_ARAVE|nr:hypothetical protein AVEN_262513-1 [Araneus ventricosus]